MRRLLPLAALALTAFGCGGAATSPHQPAVEPRAHALLVRALGAARALGRKDGPCAGCFPTDTSEITEDMYLRTGDQYGEVASASQARFRDVVYLDTAGASRLSAHHITFYLREPDGTVWRLDAGGGAPRIAPA